MMEAHLRQIAGSVLQAISVQLIHLRLLIRFRFVQKAIIALKVLQPQQFVQSAIIAPKELMCRLLVHQVIMVHLLDYLKVFVQDLAMQDIIVHHKEQQQA